MMDECDESSDLPKRSVQRNLVQILDDDVVIVFREMMPEILSGNEGVSVPGADSMNVDTVEIHAALHLRPAAAQQVDPVSARDDATEDLLEMKFGAPGLRIGNVLPIENEYAH